MAASAVACANPSQFIAKLYSEALGRAPDVAGWQANQAYFTQNGCSKSSLWTVARAIYTSAEYQSLGYDNDEKVLTVYRGLFSREPDAGGFANWRNYLNNGNSMASMIDFMFQAIDGGRELSSRQICASLGYGWSNRPAPLSNSVIPAKNDGGIQTLAALQTALENAQPGSTVYLAQRAVIMTPTQIVVKPGVTLATIGMPPPAQYAKQARVVRTGLFGNGVELDSSLIKLGSGARLQSVWVSGQAQDFAHPPLAVNVILESGTGTTIADSRVDNSAGWSSIIAHRFNKPCSGMAVRNNLVTGYANSHLYANVTDGISGNCEDFIASHNTVIDASDVAIIVFAVPGLTQKSKILNNTVVSAGVPAYGAFMLHPMRIEDAGPSNSFAGSSISNNLFWAAPDTHFDIGVILGGTAWDISPSMGVGGAAIGNSNGGIASPMYIGLAVDGMTQASVQQNTITRAVPKSAYPDNPMRYNFVCKTAITTTGDALADLNAVSGHTSGPEMIQSLENASVHGCVGHSRIGRPLPLR
jgi:hypothetical protein